MGREEAKVVDGERPDDRLLGDGKKKNKKNDEKKNLRITYGTAKQKKLDFFDEILSIEYMQGYRKSGFGNFIYWTIGLLTGGVALLLFWWFEKARINLRNKKSDVPSADKVYIKSTDNKYELCDVSWLDTVQPPLKMFVYRHTNFFFNTSTQTFERLRFKNEKRVGELQKLLESGTPPQEREQSAQLNGKNVIDFPVPSIPILLLQEVLHPFFIFQIYSVILWCFENYFYYAGAILFIALVSIIINLRETRSNLLNLKKIARFQCPVSLLKNGEFEQTDSSVLIPGDIIELKPMLTMPCDVVLLKGQAVLNESMLTGESIPIIKVPVSLEGDHSDIVAIGADARTIAYGGTQVLKIQPNAPDQKVVGMVIKCGFETSKGALILSILYPKPSHFKFFRESLKFLGILCVIGLIGFSVSVYRLLQTDDGISKVLIRALDLITIVVPPALPMAMTVGTGFALSRLKRANIYCISPPRINMAGKIEIFCFDKTGTLTEDGLDLLGLHPTINGRFDEFTTDLAVLPTAFLHTMAACHTLTTIDDKLIGDPLEVKIFQATRSVIVDGQHSNYSTTVKLPRPTDDNHRLVGHDVELGLVDRFEFQSSLQRMSVIVQDVRDPSDTIAFVKGSPEMIQTLSIPSTVPPDFAEVLHHYTNKGYRVLACGFRKYEGALKGIRKDLLRQKVECELHFLGFIVMENKIKHVTPKTLATLKKANIRCIMVTGDNALTAVSVARECGLIDTNLAVFMGDRVTDSETGEEKLAFVDVTNENGQKMVLDINTLTPEVNGKNFGNYALAITGKAWETLVLDYSRGNKKRLMKVLEKGAVFARMSPDQKAALVEELQGLGLYVAMCGDGANDCGALKAAHVGISLSEAEASIAAPFTSTRPNITCTPTLIREGRASLGVSFKLFQFMGMYSMIQFTCVILLYFKNSVLGNWQYLYQDLWTVFPLVIFMGKTTACEKLSKKRPSGRLVSGTVVGSLLLHIALCAAFQVAIFLLLPLQKWYDPHPTPPRDDPENIFIYEMTCLFTFSNFQFLIMVLVFSWGKPFLKPMFTNYFLFGTWLLLLTTSCLILLLPTTSVWNFGQLLRVPMDWRLKMGFLVICNFILCATIEIIIYLVKHRRRSTPKRKTTFEVKEGHHLASVSGDV